MNTLTERKLASLIKFNHPEYKLKDIQAILRFQDEVYKQAFQTGQRIKIGQLLFIQPMIRPSSRHYDGISSKPNNPKFVTVPKRLRYKLVPLKKLRKIQNNYEIKNED